MKLEHAALAVAVAAQPGMGPGDGRASRYNGGDRIKARGFFR